MAEFKDKLKKVIESAREEGISDEDIRGYLNLTKTALGQDEKTMDRIYKDNDVWKSEIYNQRNMDSLLDEIMNSKGDNEKGEVKNEEKTGETKLSEKSKQLLEKIDNLTQRMETEESPLKKHILAFQVKRLIAKIQREIDLNNIRDSYQAKRDELKKSKEQRELAGVDNIAGLNEQIMQLKREINGNEEYDVQSPYFMYPKKYVEQIGGPEALANKMKSSKKVETQQAAKRIENVVQKRKELQELEDKLAKEQEDLEYSNEDYKADQKGLNREEKSLIIKQKMNIFSRIGEFFNNMIEEAKLYREERKQNKELDAKENEEEAALDEEYAKKIEELKREQEERRAALREKQDESRAQQNQQQNSGRAAEFRAQVEQMAKQRKEDDATVGKPVEEVAKGEPVAASEVQAAEQDGEDR